MTEPAPTGLSRTSGTRHGAAGPARRPSRDRPGAARSVLDLSVSLHGPLVWAREVLARWIRTGWRRRSRCSSPAGWTIRTRSIPTTTTAGSRSCWISWASAISSPRWCAGPRPPQSGRPRGRRGLRCHVLPRRASGGSVTAAPWESCGISGGLGRDPARDGGSRDPGGAATAGAGVAARSGHGAPRPAGRVGTTGHGSRRRRVHRRRHSLGRHGPRPTVLADSIPAGSLSRSVASSPSGSTRGSVSAEEQRCIVDLLTELDQPALLAEVTPRHAHRPR